MICYLTRGLLNARTCLVLQELDGGNPKSMKQWKTELIASNQDLDEMCIKRGISQGDSLSPLPFALALIPVTLVLRKVKAGYNLGNGLPIINNLLFTDDLKVYGKSENNVDTLLQSRRAVSEDIRQNGNWNS